MRFSKRMRVLVAFALVAVLAVPASAAVGSYISLTGNQDPDMRVHDCGIGYDVAIAVKGFTAHDEAGFKYRKSGISSLLTYLSGDMGANSTDWIVRKTDQNTIWDVQVAAEGTITGSDWGCISSSNGTGYYRIAGSTTNPLTIK